MKKYTLLGHVFELEENAYHFLARYIDRIEHYAATHTISHEVIDDIKYSIIEKLYRFETPITESQVIEVANSLGEPEVMFDESDDNTAEDSKKENIFTREKPVIRGVCYWLAKSLNIPVKIMRIIFIILALMQGTGLILYVILALFVPYKDKKKTTGAIGSVLFEIVRIAFWLIILSAVVPLTIGAFVGTGIMFFTPVIENQSIQAWIPQYMYVVGILMSLALLILSIGSFGALFKQRWLTKPLGILAGIMIFVGVLVTVGTGYKTVMQAMNHKKTIESTIVFTGDAMSGDRVSIDMTKIADYSGSWPFVGEGSADVRIIRTTGENIEVKIKTTIFGQSEEHLNDAVTKLQPLDVSGNLNTLTLSRTGKIFTSEIPFAGVHRHVVIAVPLSRDVYIDKDWRTNMYVQNDDTGLGRGYCAARVFVYSPDADEYRCRNGEGEIYYNVPTVEGKIREEIQQEIQEDINERMRE